MKHLFSAFFIFVSLFSFSQSKIKANKYPSLLWEIRGKGMQKPSYLFGTMHVSSKMAFNLSDSFYLGIKMRRLLHWKQTRAPGKKIFLGIIWTVKIIAPLDDMDHL